MVMARKPYQFGIASLVWLVSLSAVIFGTIRYVSSASSAFFGIVLLSTMFTAPIIWLFTRPNPYRGRKRPAHPIPEDPPAPMDQRLQQFMGNVTPTEPTPPTSPSVALMPTAADGKAARERTEIGQLLRRIHGDGGTESTRQN
jgi:hypothetical protein